MRHHGSHFLAAALALAVPGIGNSAAPKTAAEIVDAAPADAWLTVPADQLLVMDLAGGGRVLIALAPAFAPVHVDNIRKLVRARAFDGGAVTRVQDDYVVQWADAGRSPPAGIVTTPPPEYERSADGLDIHPLGYRDAYAAEAGFAAGWPIGRESGRAWLAHCYGMVGVGRGMPPDTGDGRELYAVIGHAPRHLDRNITVVGRIVSGIELLAARPRGSEALGFYKTAQERGPITTVRLASDLPAGSVPAVRVINTASAAFAQWVAARANRTEDFFVRPANGVDLCNAMPPIKLTPPARK